MKEKSWRFFDIYRVNQKGIITNCKTGNQLKKTVKGYTIGYYLNGKFFSLQSIKPHLILEANDCPF